MSARYPLIWLKSPQGQLLMCEGLSICFYMRRSHAEVAQAVTRAVEIYLREVTRSVALGWYVDDEGGWRTTHASDWEALQPHSHEDREPGSHMLEPGEEPGPGHGYKVEYRGRRLDAAHPEAVSAVCFWLPTEHLAERGPEWLREVALKLAAPLPFSSGHASLAFTSQDPPEELRQLCFRYPAMDVPDLARVSRHIGDRVRGAYWLTFLGQPVLSELGGTSTLRSRLSSADITVQDLDGERAVVTLGQWPEAGDVEDGQDLPAHRELARVLEPWLLQGQRPWNGFTEEDMRRWERRFLGGPTGRSLPYRLRERCPRIRTYARNGQALIREGLSICFYMRRSHAEVAQAVMRSLDVYLRAVGPRALGWYPDSEGDWQELDARGWKHVRSELHESGSALIELKETPGGADRYKFEYFGKALDAPLFVGNPGAVSAVAFWLPTEYLEEHGPLRVRELALELAAPLPFNSGHAGLAFNALTQLVGVSGALRPLCFRHPGMNVPNLEHIAWHIGTKVRGAYWLTFLGQPVLGELGGSAGLRARLSSPDITVQDMDGERAVVTLGEWPDAGDTEQGRELPLHRELARVLEPWLYLSPPGDYTHGP
jgi:hypothetical protein